MCSIDINYISLGLFDKKTINSVQKLKRTLRCFALFFMIVLDINVKELI